MFLPSLKSLTSWPFFHSHYAAVCILNRDMLESPTMNYSGSKHSTGLLHAFASFLGGTGSLIPVYSWRSRSSFVADNYDRHTVTCHVTLAHTPFFRHPLDLPQPSNDVIEFTKDIAICSPSCNWYFVLETHVLIPENYISVCRHLRVESSWILLIMVYILIFM